MCSHVGYEEGDKVGWYMVKHWILYVYFGYQLSLTETQNVVWGYNLVECVL